MIFPTLNINESLKAIKPIIQGGMAIRVSTAKLAAAVANCGGVGVIAASGLTKDELIAQIKQARELMQNNDGLLAINIMFAARDFKDLVHTAMNEGIDLVIFGAGFSRDIFSVGQEYNIPIIPIVSSTKLAVIAKKLGASGIIVESGEAGGHLGTSKIIRDLIPEIKNALAATEGYFKKNIPIIAAGGITSGKDIIEMLKLGCNGVQMATRFVLSKECEVAEEFKKLYIKSKSKDLVLIESPVGLTARAIKTKFVEKFLNGEPVASKYCKSCLKKCSRSFCIMNALHQAQKGNLDEGLFFSGGNIEKYNEILSVEEIFNKLEEEAKEALTVEHALK